MKQSTSVVKIFLLGLVTITGVFVLVRSILPALPKTTRPTFSPKISLLVLANASASPGRKVRAIFHGNQIGMYVCKPDDAAVLLLAFCDQRGSLCESSVIQSVVDPEGHVFDSEGDQRSFVYLLRVKRGYAKRPDHVTVSLRYGIPEPNSRSEVRIDNLPEPALYLNSVRDSNNTFAIARHYDGESTVAVRLASPPEKDVAVVPEVVRSSFSPSDMRSPYYWKEANAVEVRLKTYHRTQSTKVFTYHGARTSIIDGRRALLFPERQMVGEVKGYPVFLSKFIPFPNSRSGPEVANVRLFIGNSIDHRDKSFGRPFFFRLSPVITLQSIKPSPADLGFRTIPIQLQGDHFIIGFKDKALANSPLRRTTSSSIATLEISVLIKEYQLASTRTIVLPIEHLSARANSPRLPGPMAGHFALMRGHAASAQ